MKARQDFDIVDTVILQQDLTSKFTPVHRDGTIAAANEDAFGIAVTTESEGAPVAVVRRGFCPLFGVTAANIDEGVELVVAANGQVDILPAAGGGNAYAIGIAEESLDADGGQFGAWVDCLTYGRERDIPA